MQKFNYLKLFMMLLGLVLSTVWHEVLGINAIDGFHPITVKEAHVEDVPRGSSIQASINGHYLTVVFTENLGQVAVEVTTASGAPVDGTSTITPTGIQIYIPNTGDYIVTFTLPNGDEYYGEFTVTD